MTNQRSRRVTGEHLYQYDRERLPSKPALSHHLGNYGAYYHQLGRGCPDYLGNSALVSATSKPQGTTPFSKSVPVSYPESEAVMTMSETFASGSMIGFLESA